MKYDYQDIKMLREKAEREMKNIDIGKYKENTHHKNIECNKENVHMQSCENIMKEDMMQNDRKSGRLMTLAICLCMIAAAGIWIMNASPDISGAFYDMCSKLYESPAVQGVRTAFWEIKELFTIS